MPDCSSVQKSLAWCQGKPELPGVKRRIYYISKYEILQWPVLQHDANGRLQSASYKGDFVLRADAKWKFIDILSDKSQLTSEPQGEYPSQTQLNKLVAVHPGVDEDASAATAYLNNNDNVFLVEDMRNAFRVVGSDKWATKTTVAQDLGQGAAGTTSTTINVEATDECPAPFYAGKIATEDGTINPEGNPNQATSEDNPGGSNSRQNEDIHDDDNGGGSGKTGGEVNTGGDNTGGNSGGNSGGQSSGGGNTGGGSSSESGSGASSAEGRIVFDNGNYYERTAIINSKTYSNIKDNDVIEITGPLTYLEFHGSGNNTAVAIGYINSEGVSGNAMLQSSTTNVDKKFSGTIDYQPTQNLTIKYKSPAGKLVSWFTIKVMESGSSSGSGSASGNTGGSNTGGSSGGNTGGNTGGNSGGTSSGNSGSDEIAYSGKNGVSYNKGVILNGTKYSVEKGGNINFSGTLKSITVTGVNVKDIRLKYTENGAEKYQQFNVDESNTTAKWTGKLNPTQTVTVRVDDGSQFQLVTLCTIDIQP